MNGKFFDALKSAIYLFSLAYSLVFISALTGCALYGGAIPIALGQNSDGKIFFMTGHAGLGVVPGQIGVDCRAVCFQRASNGDACNEVVTTAAGFCKNGKLEGGLWEKRVLQAEHGPNTEW